MKRSNSKELNIVTVVVVLTLAFLCIFNISYSYFTASDVINGSGYKFGEIGVQFNFTTDTTDSITVNSTNSVLLEPTGTVTRGGTFNLQYNDEAVEGVGFSLLENSSDVFIRYWVDAYIEGDSTNYGYCFILMYGGSDIYYEEKDLNAGYTNNIYYVQDVLSSEVSDGIVYEFDQIQLISDCPAELIGSDVVITLSFEAVQAANEAYKVEFDDDKGYNADWEYTR